MIFLCGKGRAAEQILREMVAAQVRVAVFTHPEQNIILLAQELGVQYETRTVNDVEKWPWKPSGICSVGYLTIIHPHVIDAVHGRVWNCHYALLPNHRGRSAVPWAIVDGDRVTGITYHWITSEIDTGNVLLQAVCDVEPDDTQTTLFDKLDRLAVGHWHSAMRLAMVDMPGVPQQGRTQYHRAGPPHNGEIDPLWEPDRIERFIRAMTYPPLPGATCGGTPIGSVSEFWFLRRGEMEPTL
jgi:methionyl-tRNA formyltransferase